MIFLDTNILVDVLEPQSSHEAAWSRLTLSRFAQDQQLASNIIVVAELAAQMAAPKKVMRTLRDAEVSIIDLDVPVALRAASAFGDYRRRGGSRATILPDFLIAGHAAVMGASLMTRDRRLSSYFPDLAFITPETHPHG